MKLKLAILTILALLLMSKLTFVLNIVPTRTLPLDSPTHIRLSWQNETSTTITVTWETNTSQAGDTVLFDTVSRNGVPASYAFSASGVNHTYGGASGYIHNVELTGLAPNTVYYFVCGGDVGGWSGERAFRTAPSVSSDVRFVVGGDSRSNIVEREIISEAMAEFNPSFVVHSGDLVNDGRVQSEWDSWFSDVDSHWIGENNLTIPVIPAVGNHEQPNDPATKYFVQFALPGNERWYSCDWGPDIHMVYLDSESPADGAQRDWLENDLATHANYTWKFVTFHKPPFVSGSHAPWTPALTYWVPLFDKYHVDVVFNGHDHNYQRTHPLNWTASQTEPQDYSNGTMYIVTGGWGAPLYDPKPIWYMAYQNKTYHFCVVDIYTNGTLHLQAKDNQGNTFDEIKIHRDTPSKSASWPLRRYNLRNTGFTPSGAPDEQQVLWFYNKSIVIAASPAIEEYTVFIPGSSPNATLTALDAITGVPLWEIPQESGSVQPPGIDKDKGLVVYGVTDGHVKCVDMYTGASVWDVTPWTNGSGGPGVYGWFVSAPQIDSANGLVFIGTFIPYGDGYAYCLNETNGDVVWWWGPVYSKTMGTVSAVDGDVVFFGCSDDHLYAVNKFTGDTIWSFYVGMNYSHVISAPAISGDYLFVGGGSVGYMYCINKTTGEELWRYFGGNHTVGEMGTTRSPCLDEVRGWVIGTADNGTLYALDMESGSQIWRTNLPYDEEMGQFQSMDPILTGDGKIVINSHSNAWIKMGYEQVLVYDETDGSLLWSYLTTPYEAIPANRPKALVSVATPCVAYDHIYVGCYDKLFYCFGEAWPYTVTITDPISDSNIARGSKLTIKCDVKDSSGDPVSGANVTAVISAETEPWGITVLKEFVDTLTLSETDTPGTYTGSYSVEEEEPLGKWNIIVRAVKDDEVGGDHVYILTSRVPVASFTHTPTDPVFNETVTFDASASTPNGGIILSYVWDFGDGYTGTGQLINHTYTMPGNYTVGLNVTDVEGHWNYASADITVVPEFPSFLILPLFMLATLLTVIVCRRKHFWCRIANNRRSS